MLELLDVELLCEEVELLREEDSLELEPREGALGVLLNASRILLIVLLLIQLGKPT